MLLRRRPFCARAIAVIFAAQVQAGVQFQPVSQEQLRMTNEPNAPGAQAISLYREGDDCGVMGDIASAGLGCTLPKAGSVFRSVSSVELKSASSNTESELTRSISSSLLKGWTILLSKSLSVGKPQVFRNLRIKTFAWWATPFRQRAAKAPCT